MQTKFFNLRSHRWNVIEKSKLGTEFVTIRRPIPARSTMGVIGQCVIGMDVPKDDIPVHLLIEFEKQNK